MTALDPVETHQALDAPAVHCVSEAPQLGVDTPDPVRSLVLGVDLADVRDQDRLGGRCPARALAPAIHRLKPERET
jgi:hypothetical protein